MQKEGKFCNFYNYAELGCNAAHQTSLDINLKYNFYILFFINHEDI
ncbi:hypothetical protein NOC27_62 [Nitrosococcus oceani AFC27]|nr:hypothetical protein NOC27_62 [Nitrosococcus oceani AFC27]